MGLLGKRLAADSTRRFRRGNWGIESLERRDCPAAAPFPGSTFNAVPTLSVSDVTVTEGDSGTATAKFSVRLSAASSSTVRVSYGTADSTATASGRDYQSTSGTIWFAPNEIVKVVSVSVIGDTTSEPDEYFGLRLSGAVGAMIFDGMGTCTIGNNDPPTVTPPQTTAPKPSPSPSPSPGRGFQITLTFASGVPTSVQTAARAAATRWEQVITGDLPDVPDGTTVVDDIVINVQMGLLGNSSTDGQYGTLANAGPTRLRPGLPGLPWKAECGIDPADGGSSAMVTILTHEFGHALGFPNGRQFQSYISGSTFTGPNAVREYKAFKASATSVPMDNVQGHWDEATFGRELMTPMLNNGTQYLSRITVGAMQDAGYKVDYTKADKGYVPSAFAALTQSASAVGVPFTGVRLLHAFSAASVAHSPAFAAFASLPAFTDWHDGQDARGWQVVQKTRGVATRVAPPATRGAIGPARLA